MKVLPRGLRVVPVTPLSRGPTVEMIDVDDLAKVGVTGDAAVLDWCQEHSALFHEEDRRRFALDVTAAYALGKGFLRCVYRR